MVDVNIYLNVQTDEAGRSIGYSGFKRDHKLEHASTYQIEDHEYPRALDQAFDLFNIGEMQETPLTHVAVAYRAAGHRSLSVGDVIVVGDDAYSVDSFSFTALGSIKELVTN